MATRFALALRTKNAITRHAFYFFTGRDAMRLCCAFILLFLCCTVGCSLTPQSRAVLTQYENDLRRYEDLIYELEYEYEILCDENEALKNRLANWESESGSSNSTPSRLFRPKQDSPPLKSKKPNTPIEEQPMDELVPPVIDTGTMQPMKPTVPETPPAETPRTPEIRRTPDSKPLELERTPAETEKIHSPSTTIPSPAKPFSTPILPLPKREKQINALPPLKNDAPVETETLPPPREERTFSKPLELLPSPPDDKVSTLFIDPHQTRGLDLDPTAGDEGVRLTMQPRNAAGESVAALGKVTVVLIDPHKEGEGARVGRWEFDPQQVRYASRRRQLTLDLPWQEIKPDNPNLALFVRYESLDGEQHNAKQVVRVTPPNTSLASNGWTPRSSVRDELKMATAPASTPVVVPATESMPSEHVAPAAHTEDPRETTPASSSPKEPTKKPSLSKPLVRPQWKPNR
jgi:hypothetical protein